MPHAAKQTRDQVEVAIRWKRYIKPTDVIDYAFGTCVFGDYVAVMGGASLRPYVALLRKGDGVVVREWMSSEDEGLYNCISIDGKLYAVGTTMVGYDYYGAIYVFDVNLNILEKIASESPSFYYSLAYDGEALYIGGMVFEDVDGDGIREDVGLVEKRALDENLSLVNSKKICFGSWKDGEIYDVGVEPSTGRIWVAGAILTLMVKLTH